MQPSIIEKRLLKEGETLIVGTSCVGADNYVGPVISCSVVLDYNKLTPYFNNLVEDLPLDVKGMQTILQSLKYFVIHITKEEELNNLNGPEMAVYYSNFCCVNKLIWDMLKKREVPSAFITDKFDLKEVVHSSFDSLHSANKQISDFMIWDVPPTLNMLAPQAQYIKTNKRSNVLCVQIANKLANRQLKSCLKNIDKEIPQYHILEKSGKEQINIVKTLGNSQYHRLFIKELAKYPINTLIKKEN